MRHRNQVDEAVACHRKATELNPTHPFGWHNLSIALVALHDESKLDEAVASSRRALAIQEFPAAWNSLGIALLLQQKFEEAIAAYRRAIEMYPSYSEAWRSLGDALLALGEDDRLVEAVEAYRKALNFNPQDAAAWNNLGVVLLRQKKTVEALAAFQRAAELDPDLDNLTNLAWHLATAEDPNLRDPALAVICAERAVKLKPEANNWNNLGVAWYRAGNWAQAVEFLEKADAMLDHKDRDHRFFLAMAHWQLGHDDKAQRFYQEGAEYQQKYSDNPELHRFRAEADRLMRGPAVAEKPLMSIQPFVLLGKPGDPNRSFSSLQEAVSHSVPGSRIEVRGHGPFVTDRVYVRHPLVIRAGEGFAPTLRLSPASTEENLPVFGSPASLVLEGLTLERIGGPDKAANGRAPYLINAFGPGMLALANCRLTGGILINAHVSELTLRNCVLTTDRFLAIDWYYPTGARLSIENCASTNGMQFKRQKPGGTVSVTVRHSTFAGRGLTFTSFDEPAWSIEDETPPIRLTFAENICAESPVLTHNQLGFETPFQADEVERFLPRLLGLSGQRNVVPQNAWRLNIGVNGQPPEMKTSAHQTAWDTFWAERIGESFEGPVHLHGEYVAERARIAPQRVTAEHFRLDRDSAGYRASADGNDLGANIDLLGPGAAYERWKKIPEYQDWLETARRLMTAIAIETTDKIK